MTTDPTSQALTEAERAALTKWAVAFYRPEDLYAAIVRIVAARVAAARAEALQPVRALADEWEQLADAADTGDFAKRQRWAGALRARANEVRAVVSREPGEGDMS